jgi:hypothetical protein
MFSKEDSLKSVMSMSKKREFIDMVVKNWRDENLSHNLGEILKKSIYLYDMWDLDTICQIKMLDQKKYHTNLAIKHSLQAIEQCLYQKYVFCLFHALENFASSIKSSDAIYYDMVHVACQYFTIFKAVRLEFPSYRGEKLNPELIEGGKYAALLSRHPSSAKLVLEKYLNSEEDLAFKNMRFLKRESKFMENFDKVEYMPRNWIEKFFNTKRFIQSYAPEILRQIKQCPFVNIEFLEGTIEAVLLNFLKQKNDLVFENSSKYVQMKSFDHYKTLTKDSE